MTCAANFRPLVCFLCLLLAITVATAQQDGRLVPDDPSFPDQWSLDQTSDCDIDAPEAWHQETGRPHVVIAVLDTGIDLDAVAFAGRLLTGRNVVSEGLPPADENGRGTQLASLAAAAGNDGTGIAGVCWGCSLLPVKVSDDTGLTYTYRVAEGIVWAAEQGADLILVGQSHPSPNSGLFSAVQDARALGALTFGPVGDAANTYAYIPAAYYSAIGVGASDLEDLWAGTYTNDPDHGSNHHDKVDLVAPGDWVLVSGIDGFQARVSRTRFATAYAVGAAGLALSVQRTLGLDELRQLLLAAARDEAGDPAQDVPGHDEYHGHGRLNAAKVVQGARSARSLVVEQGTGTTVRLEVPADIALAYDFVRGQVSGLSFQQSPPEVRLGGLVCLENNSPDASTGGVLVDEDPLPGRAFFYLARAVTRIEERSYGGSADHLDRKSWTGDCSYGAP
jgi:hypothetical protein